MTHVLLYSLSLFCLTINILIFICTVVWGQWAVPAYFQSKRLLPFGFAGQSNYFEVIFCASALYRMRPLVYCAMILIIVFCFFITGGLHDSDQH